MAAATSRTKLLQLICPDRRCAGCGVRKRSYAALEINHVDQRTWIASKLNRWSRVAHYWRDYRAGVRLNAMCRRCNARDGRARQLANSFQLQRRAA